MKTLYWWFFTQQITVTILQDPCFRHNQQKKNSALILSALCRPRWLIRSAYGSKLRGTWFESRSRWIFVIDVGYIHCSKPFKCMECAVLSMRVRTIKNPRSHSIRVGHSPDFGLPPVSILSWLCKKRRKAIFTLFTHFASMMFTYLHPLWSFVANSFYFGSALFYQLCRYLTTLYIFLDLTQLTVCRPRLIKKLLGLGWEFVFKPGAISWVKRWFSPKVGHRAHIHLKILLFYSEVMKCLKVDNSIIRWKRRTGRDP